jgi:hypothetical protein
MDHEGSQDLIFTGRRCICRLFEMDEVGKNGLPSRSTRGFSSGTPCNYTCNYERLAWISTEANHTNAKR